MPSIYGLATQSSFLLINTASSSSLYTLMTGTTKVGLCVKNGVYYIWSTTV